MTRLYAFSYHFTVRCCIGNLGSCSHDLVLPHGYGKHLWVGPSDAALGWAIALFLSEPIYICILCTVKFSLLAFYWRLFKQTTIIRIPIYTLATVVSCWGIASVRPFVATRGSSAQAYPDTDLNISMHPSSQLLGSILPN